MYEWGACPRKLYESVLLSTMPTVLKVNGFRFYFYSNESNEPCHIHVEKADGNAKYWLDPVAEVYSYDFTVQQRKDIARLINSNSEKFKNAWYEYFK